MTTNLTTREKPHKLINELPDSELAMTECLLKDLVNGTRDPLLWKLMSAPWDDEPETEEERAAVQEAREQVARGEVISDEELWRRLGHEPSH